MCDSPDSALPAGFRRPRAAHAGQASLFSIPVDEWLARRGISLDEVERWQGWGWMGPLPDPNDLDDAHPWCDRCQLVSALVRFGLSDVIVSKLLNELRDRHARDVAYSFTYGWVAPDPSADELSVEQVVARLEEYEEDDLASLRDAIDARLLSLRAGALHDPEGHGA